MTGEPNGIEYRVGIPDGYRYNPNVRGGIEKCVQKESVSFVKKIENMYLVITTYVRNIIKRC